jgi:periplasmic protein TonB
MLPGRPQVPGGAQQRPAGRLNARRAEIVRWAVCFAVAATLHGGAVAALLYGVSEPADDSSVDAPVMMIELPAWDAPAVAQDLPPGPMEQQENEPAPAPPPPREETRPSEQVAEAPLPIPEPPKPEPPAEKERPPAPPAEEAKPPEPPVPAEVTLPMPEPPKPPPPRQEPPRHESPAEEKHRAAPPPARAQRKDVERWQRQVSAHIQQFQRYPAAAHARQESGVAQVVYTIDRQGHLLRSSIGQSTGSAALDQEALDTLARAQPMPPPPDDMTDAGLTLVMPVRFDR